MWIGLVGGGLNRFNMETGEFTHYYNNENNEFAPDEILAMIEVEGNLWIGWFNSPAKGGLSIFNKDTGKNAIWNGKETKNFIRWKEEHGFN